MRPLVQLPSVSEDATLDGPALARLAIAGQGLGVIAVTKAEEKEQVVAVLLASDLVDALGGQQPLPPLKELLSASGAYERVLRVPYSFMLSQAAELAQRKGARVIFVADASDDGFTDKSSPLPADSIIDGFVAVDDLLKAWTNARTARKSRQISVHF